MGANREGLLKTTSYQWSVKRGHRPASYYGEEPRLKDGPNPLTHREILIPVLKQEIGWAHLRKRRPTIRSGHSK